MSISTQNKIKHNKWIMLVDDNFTIDHFNVIESFGYKAFDAKEYVDNRIDYNWTHLAYGCYDSYEVQGTSIDPEYDEIFINTKYFPNFISFLEDHLEMRND